MNLSATQVEVIRLRLERSGITLSLLKDDLLDHICCAIEDQVAAGWDFETAFSAAVDELAPKGLIDIEEQTALMLNHKLIPMKKITYVIGLLGCMLMVIGWIMRTLHWPRPFELDTMGVAVFVVVFLPMLAFSRFSSAAAMPRYEKILIITGICSGIIAVLGFVFKMMHWNGANLLLLLGSLVLSFGFLPFLFFSMYKKSVAS